MPLHKEFQLDRNGMRESLTKHLDRKALLSLVASKR